MNEDESKKICKVNPTKIIVYENGRCLEYVKPCGVKYTDRHEVHCPRWEERACEYMMLSYMGENNDRKDV